MRIKIISLSLILGLVGTSHSAMFFDGDGDVIRAVGRVTNSTTGTISAWINSVALGTGEVNMIVGYGGGNVATPGLFAFRLQEASGVTYVYIAQRSDGSATVNLVRTAYTQTGWTHVALTSNDTTWTVYVNGVSRSLSVVTGANNGNWFGDTTVADTKVTSIGSLYYDGGFLNNFSFHGSIDDVRIFDRVLSANEIESLYKSRKRIILNAPNGHWWMLDDLTAGANAVGNTIKDRLDSTWNMTGFELGTGVGPYGSDSVISYSGGSR